MAPLLIHAGFHKTGTTSVQKMLEKSRRDLKPHLRVFTRARMVATCEAARTYSASRKASDLLAFATEIGTLFESLTPEDPRPAIISSEDLSGFMPGRNNQTKYDAAPLLMRTIAETAKMVWPTPPPLIFFFSTRAGEPWLRSCYAQHLRAVRVKVDFETYAKRHAESADLEAIVTGVRAAVAPHAVVSHALEDCATRGLGPLAPILDTLEFPRELRRKITKLPPANTSLPPELQAAFLQINRSSLDDQTVAQAKAEARKIYFKE